MNKFAARRLKHATERSNSGQNIQTKAEACSHPSSKPSPSLSNETNSATLPQPTSQVPNILPLLFDISFYCPTQFESKKLFDLRIKEEIS
jgi:hypothetical protein